FPHAVRIAGGASECLELEPGRYRATFRLGDDPAVYKQLGRLLATVRHWRSTDVYNLDGPASAYQARELSWCAASQLDSFGSGQGAEPGRKKLNRVVRQDHADVQISRLTVARVARLVRTDPDGRRQLVPIVFAVEGDTLYSAVDRKRKRSRTLPRIENARARPD